MSDLVPKKERHLWYWLQWITICISLLAVFASTFAGWMAYNASVTSAEISGKMNKENELESRWFQEKKDIYWKLYQYAKSLEGVDSMYAWLEVFSDTLYYASWWIWKDIDLIASAEVKGLIACYKLSLLMTYAQESLKWTIKEDDMKSSFKENPILLDIYKTEPLVISLLLQEQIRSELFNPWLKINFSKIKRPISSEERAEIVSNSQIGSTNLRCLYSWGKGCTYVDIPKKRFWISETDWIANIELLYNNCINDTY
jgi:hypothetical protein